MPEPAVPFKPELTASYNPTLRGICLTPPFLRGCKQQTAHLKAQSATDSLLIVKNNYAPGDGHAGILYAMVFSSQTEIFGITVITYRVQKGEIQ